MTKNTGEALQKVYKNVLLDTNPILIWNEDILAPLNPKALVEKHQKHHADATIANKQATNYH